MDVGGRPQERPFDVLVVGELNPDVLVFDPVARPVFGQVETLVEVVSLAIGSSSAIFACGVARLGLRTAFVGVVGDDAFGRFMMTALSERGVDVSACIVDATVPTGASVVLSSGDDRAILTARGAIGALRGDQVPLDLLRRARHLHVGSTYLQTALQPDLPRLFRVAHREGLTVSFDCNWDPSGRWDASIDELLVESDLFLPNAAEARNLTGLSDDREAARALVRRGMRGRTIAAPLVVAVKRGPNGAFATSGEEEVERPALAVPVRDTTGAGDSFDAGMVFGLLARWPLDSALELAVACGSLACRAIGGTESQPTLEEALRALGAVGLP
ncbi:MAG: carbohydrate kinase [Chloroflexota bacterium]